MSEVEKKPTIQKYCLIHDDADGVRQFEVFDMKQHLKKRLKEVERADIHLIIKGRLLRIKIEERLTV